MRVFNDSECKKNMSAFHDVVIIWEIAAHDGMHHCIKSYNNAVILEKVRYHLYFYSSTYNYVMLIIVIDFRYKTSHFNTKTITQEI